MLPRRHILGLILALPFSFGAASAGLSATPDFFAPGGLAIHGYDPVAYVEDAKAVRGSEAFDLMWGGAIWQFSSAAHMAAFEADPWRYAPQYGGYCAYELSKGGVATTVPEAWAVVNGKLYLTHSKAVQAIWKSDVAGNVAAAEAHWPSVLNR
ncbi:YHS domain-containing (seleno)protein [Pseudogemmobacter sp. W21_MBD1_M6]|uniref:YHS domain-containing (seleno)protein n=1 Tax=Pseudogemmobacter sp. W21_MBD1_M6 TaxID=3240271 RepID=UPI003F9E847C